MQEHFLAADVRFLAEASHCDTIWRMGCLEDASFDQSPSLWRGQSFIGSDLQVVGCIVRVDPTNRENIFEHLLLNPLT